MRSASWIRRIAMSAILLSGTAHCTAPGDPHEELPATTETGSSLTTPWGTQRWFVLEVGDRIGGHPDYRNPQTFLHVVNTNSVDVGVEARIQGDAGRPPSRFFTVPRQSRRTLSFGGPELGGAGQGFNSIELFSTTPGADIQVSSTMLNDAVFGPSFWEASKAVNAATQPRPAWFFGEGGSYGTFPPIGGPVFDHWVIVYNPNSFAISVNSAFFSDENDGSLSPVAGPPLTVAANSRIAFNPYTGAPPWTSVHTRSARVDCSSPCFAQLIMNQLNGVPGRRPNTQSALGSSPAQRWFVVGIPTTGEWQNRIYIFNNSPHRNGITLRYRDRSGNIIPPVFTDSIEPFRRISYDTSGPKPGDAPIPAAPAGRGGGDLSLEITADHPIALTKINYWLRDFSWSEGASTTGHAQGGTRVVIPGGNVGGGFENFLHVMNVGGAATEVIATTFFDNGRAPLRRSLGVLNAMGMLQLNSAPLLPGGGNFATQLEASQPLIAESMTLFARDPSTLWRAGDTVEGIVFSGATPLEP